MAITFNLQKQKESYRVEILYKDSKYNLLFK